MTQCLAGDCISELIVILKCGCKLEYNWFGTGKNLYTTITAALYMASFTGCLTICLLSQVQVQTNFIFVVKSLYFQNDWLARKTINHLTQDFGKKEI